MRIYKAGKKFGVDFTWRGGRVRLVGYSSKRPTEALGRKLEELSWLAGWKSCHMILSRSCAIIGYWNQVKWRLLNA